MLQEILAKIRAWKRKESGFHPLINVRISRSALLCNLHVLQSLVPQWEMAPVLKSNAYGHGLLTVARVLESEKDIPFFCVDSHFEAQLLRRGGISKPLLVIGYTPLSIIRETDLNDVAFSIGSIEQLDGLIKSGQRKKVQIKVDTGMHRQGIDCAKIDEAIGMLKLARQLEVVGVFSHLADGDVPGSEITRRQIEKWNFVVQKMQSAFPGMLYSHLSNSAGLADASKMRANVGRIGLALYGINPGGLTVKLRPALSVDTEISGLRVIESGEAVGYSATFVADRPTKVATVPAGYFEGVDRRLSGRGFFLIKNKVAPILGRVSMNISTCDVTEIPDVQIGSQVSIVSNISDDPNSVENIAKQCGTIPYEILIHIPAHLRRTVVD